MFWGPMHIPFLLPSQPTQVTCYINLTHEYPGRPTHMADSIIKHAISFLAVDVSTVHTHCIWSDDKVKLA